MALIFSKQSLIDWYVEDDGKPQGKRVVARIEKVRVPGVGYGYEVRLRMFDFEGPYFYATFKEAKQSAMDPSGHPD